MVDPQMKFSQADDEQRAPRHYHETTRAERELAAGWLIWGTAGLLFILGVVGAAWVVTMPLFLLLVVGSFWFNRKWNEEKKNVRQPPSSRDSTGKSA